MALFQLAAVGPGLYVLFLLSATPVATFPAPVLVVIAAPPRWGKVARALARWARAMPLVPAVRLMILIPLTL